MLYVNCYDPAAPLLALRSLGWSGARRDILSIADAADRLSAHARAGLGVNLLLNLPPEEAAGLAISLLAELDVLLAPSHVAIEVGNEWNLRYDPSRARHAWEDVVDAAPLYTDVKIVTGGISDLSTAALGWLKEAFPPVPDLVCGFHGYIGNRKLVPADRAIQLQALRAVVGDHEAWNTETGWHQASTPRPFPFCLSKTKLSEDDVLENLKTDVLVHVLYGVDHYCVYQIHDGPRDTPENRFGIRAYDGRWKKQSTLPAAVASL